MTWKTLPNFARNLSSWLQPAPLASPPGRLVLTASCIPIVAVSLYKIALVLSGTVQLTHSDGTSRLFLAITRYWEEGSFWGSITWNDMPLPVPQVFYLLLYQIDRATNGIVAVNTSVLIVNILLFAAGTLVLTYVAFLAFGRAALLTAILLSLASMPAFISTTEAVEPFAFSLFSLSLLFALRALASNSPRAWSVASAAALLASSLFRIELFTFSLPMAMLLYAKIGRKITFLYVAISSAFFLAFTYAIPMIYPDVKSYSEISALYSLRPLTTVEFLASPILKGMEGSWSPALVFWAAPFAAAAGLFLRQIRFVSALALFATLQIIFFTMSGRVSAGQPRYALFAICLLCLPMGYWLHRLYQSVSDVLFVGRSVAFGAVTAIIFAAALVPSLLALESSMELRAKGPSSDLRQAKDFLLSKLSPGETIFTDHLYWTGEYVALHVDEKNRGLSFTTLSRCCVSANPRTRLSADRITQLTHAKGSGIFNLDRASLFQMYQVYGHGFIERHQPRFLVFLSGSRLGSWRNRPDVPKDAFSIMLSDMTKVSAISGQEIYVAQPRYSSASFCVVKRFENKSIRILEAFYPRPGEASQTAASCSRLGESDGSSASLKVGKAAIAGHMALGPRHP